MTEPTETDWSSEAVDASGPARGQKVQLRLLMAAALPWVAPALLVVIAVQQIILASTASLTPWKGGGFGMFVSVDRSGSRIVRAVLVADGRKIPIRLRESDGFGPAFSKASVLPTRARLTALAESLASRTWLLDRSTQVATLAGAGTPPIGTQTIRRPDIHLEVDRVQFNPQTLELKRVFIADATAGGR